MWGGDEARQVGDKKTKPIFAPPLGVGTKYCPIPAPPPLWGGVGWGGLKRGGAKLPSLSGIPRMSDAGVAPLALHQCFPSHNENKRNMSKWTFWKIYFSSILQFPTANPIQRTFLSWNFTIAFVSLTDCKDSRWVTIFENLPAVTSSMIKARHRKNLVSNLWIMIIKTKGHTTQRKVC